MNEIYVWKNRIVELYNSKSTYVDIALKFIVSFMVFTFINSHIGYMSLLSSGLVVIALAAVCSILPSVMLLLIAALIILLHIYSLSLVLAGCVAVAFVMLFIVYFRFTSNLAIVAILTPIAFGFNMQYILPIACGLLIGPAAALPIGCGIMAYSIIGIVESMSESLSGTGLDEMIADAMTFGLAILDEKDMMLYVVVLAVTTVAVFGAKKLPIDHSWKIAIGVGFLTSIISATIVGSILDVEVAMAGIVIGNIVAAVVGIVIEFLFLGVEYKKIEIVEFEDDEYHYYVKAVPKIKADKVVPSVSDLYGDGYGDESNDIYSNGNQNQYTDSYGENYQEEPNDEYDNEYENIYDESYLEEQENNKFQQGQDVGYEGEWDQRVSGYEPIEPLSEKDRYEADLEELLEQDATTIINSDDVERELRNNAHDKSIKDNKNKEKHNETNYKMLKESMKKYFNK